MSNRRLARASRACASGWNGRSAAIGSLASDTNVGGATEGIWAVAASGSGAFIAASRNRSAAFFRRSRRIRETEVLQLQRWGSGRVSEWVLPGISVPQAPVRCRDYRDLRPMVSAFLTQSPGRGRADGRARLIRGPHYDLALDADLCSGGAAPVARAGEAQRIDLAHGRDLCADLWSLDVPVSRSR